MWRQRILRKYKGRRGIVYSRQLPFPPLSYPRSVLSSLLVPSSSPSFRCRQYLSAFDHGAIGGYTDGEGIRIVRREVSDFIKRRDGIDSREQDAVIIQNSNDAILVPSPECTLIGDLIKHNEGKKIEYRLDENGWRITDQCLEKALEKSKGLRIRAIVVVNPGNPTGQILEDEDLIRVLKFAHDRKICVIADEVHQEATYTKKFKSIRKVLSQLGNPYNEDLEVISFHSISKGITFEGGLRGGYMELYNIHDIVKQMIYKAKAVRSCSNTIGQVSVGLMVNPPTIENATDEDVKQYNLERNMALNCLKEHANLLSTKLNSIKGITCNPLEGGYYVFPKIMLPQKYINKASKENISPDIKFSYDAK